MESFRDRIGYDSGATPLEATLAWAAAHDFHYIDFKADLAPNIMTGWTDERVQAVREACARSNIHLGLHTSSSVNVAEYSPYVAEGVEQYLRANVDLAVRLGCEWGERSTLATTSAQTSRRERRAPGNGWSARWLTLRASICNS